MSWNCEDKRTSCVLADGPIRIAGDPAYCGVWASPPEVKEQLEEYGRIFRDPIEHEKSLGNNNNNAESLNDEVVQSLKAEMTVMEGEIKATEERHELFLDSEKEVSRMMKEKLGTIQQLLMAKK